uniref:Uncharacterized protein n=1 Tax=Pyxicephalus adspersus TaxID=30357 RepID=A0AAV2ZMR8_PYXAD|nr:TPA: hypothetical protein GDO54_003110 [Pyxicephalus adspersus]
MTCNPHSSLVFIAHVEPTSPVTYCSMLNPLHLSHAPSAPLCTPVRHILANKTYIHSLISPTFFILGHRHFCYWLLETIFTLPMNRKSAAPCTLYYIQLCIDQIVVESD